jgi:hypothetical protein
LFRNSMYVICLIDDLVFSKKNLFFISIMISSFFIYDATVLTNKQSNLSATFLTSAAPNII